jgi:hypothetical protein
VPKTVEERIEKAIFWPPVKWEELKGGLWSLKTSGRAK